MSNLTQEIQTEQHCKSYFLRLKVRRHTVPQSFCTFLLCMAFSAQLKLAVRKKRRPTKTLLRVKTSATMAHCQLSLDTANRTPPSTAPGPGPANLTVQMNRVLFFTQLQTQLWLYKQTHKYHVLSKSQTALWDLCGRLKWFHLCRNAYISANFKFFSVIFYLITLHCTSTKKDAEQHSQQLHASLKIFSAKNHHFPQTNLGTHYNLPSAQVFFSDKT